MSNSRALVSCTILSLQDSSFMYPFCKSCLSRLTVEANTRARCARCGFTCDVENVDFRYRLSVKVSRNQDIFGVTVFGGCLNPFFGITAGGLQRFVDLVKSDGTHTVQQLLIKAVEDCFIGRCVVFGLKVSGNDARSCLPDHHTSSLGFKSGQLVACQIISPSEALVGSTVIAYFKNLLKLNSHSCSSASFNNISLSQSKNSPSSPSDELNSFDYTLPSCARLNSQPSQGGFTFSSVWQSPGLSFTPEEKGNDSLQQFRNYDVNPLSPKNVDTRSCIPSLQILPDECFWSCQTPFNQLNHANSMQDEVKDETLNSNRKSFSSSYDMFESSAHLSRSGACNPKYPMRIMKSEITTSSHSLSQVKPEGKNDEPFLERSLSCNSDQNIYFDLEDAPLSESLNDFLIASPQKSETVDTKKRKVSDEHNSGQRNQIMQNKMKCSLIENSLVTSIMSKTTSTVQISNCSDKSVSSPLCDVNDISWKENNENVCPRSPEVMMNNADIPKTKNVLCATNSSGQKKKKIIHSDLIMPFSSDNVGVFNQLTNNRLSFTNRKDLTLKRTKLTKSRPSVAFCSPNHDENKYFRHGTQSGVHSVTCKVKQKQVVFDDHGDSYNCSADLFASCENSMDMNQSDVKEISIVNEPRNVHTTEPGISGSLIFSPCLQSTPVSYYQHSIGQRTGQKRLDSRRFKPEFKSSITVLRQSCDNQKNKPTVRNSPTLKEIFSGESSLQDPSFNSDSSVNVNEWSRDLFENSF